MSGTAGTAGNEGQQPVAGTPIPGEELGAASTGHGAASIDYEKIARETGWKPKEEFDGPEDVWVGPEEFVKRKPLLDKLKSQTKQIKRLGETVEAISKHYAISVEQAKAKAIADLKAERVNAIEVGDAVKVDEIDQQIEQVKQMEPPATAPSLPPEIADFVDTHKEWFNKDKEMTRFAVSYNESYLKEHGGDLETSLKKTLEAVKKAFPDKFKNQKREEPQPVEGGGAPPSGGGKGKYTLNRLNHEQRLVYDQLVVRHGQMSHEDYFKQLDEAGYLER